MLMKFPERSLKKKKPMDINAKKVEIIQHIIIIQKPEVIQKIDKFIRDLEYVDEDGFYNKKPDRSDNSRKKEVKSINEVGRKIIGKLNFYK